MTSLGYLVEKDEGIRRRRVEKAALRQILTLSRLLRLGQVITTTGVTQKALSVMERFASSNRLHHVCSGPSSPVGRGGDMYTPDAF